MSMDNKQDLGRDLLEGKISRREFVSRALSLGVSLTAIGAILRGQGAEQIAAYSTESGVVAAEPMQLASPVQELQSATFVIDDVVVNVTTPFLPSDAIGEPQPGDAIQGASSVSWEPFGQFSVVAIPVGSVPYSETTVPAKAGGANQLRSEIASANSTSMASLDPAIVPTAKIFGQDVAGDAWIVSTVLDDTGPKSLATVVWVGDSSSSNMASGVSRQRLWVVRVVQELPTGEGNAASLQNFVNTLSGIVITSKKLNVPTTIVRSSTSVAATCLPDSGCALITDPNPGPMLPQPAWWHNDPFDSRFYQSGGAVDPAKHCYGPPRNSSRLPAYGLGASFRGVAACGPRHVYPPYGDDVEVCFFNGAHGQYEWECVELVMRYMYLAYGVRPYPGHGFAVVENYPGTALKKYRNVDASRDRVSPLPGDVLSYYGGDFGHTSICSGVKINAQGSGTIKIIEQNNSCYGEKCLAVRNWRVQLDGRLVVTGWLHKLPLAEIDDYGDSLFFRPTSKFADRDFRALWKQPGNGMFACGYPLREEATEQVTVNGATVTIRVQYFENARLEKWPDSPTARFGAVGTRYQDARRSAGNPLPQGTDNRSGEYFAPTNHWVGGDFLSLYRTYGLFTCGYPLTGEFDERVNPTTSIRVQYFENVKMEKWPGTAQARFGAVGRAYLDCLDGRCTA